MSVVSNTTRFVNRSASQINFDREEVDSGLENPNVTQMQARELLLKKYHSKTFGMRVMFADHLCLRSLPVATFLADGPRHWALQITSIDEDRLLKAIGLSSSERSQIEGLQSVRNLAQQSIEFAGLSVKQISSKAVARLAANPPRDVGVMQRRTSKYLLRPFPLGLRFSGNNMSPLPGWLAGAQSVTLNMSNNDLAVQLHFALFRGSGGFVLKPPEMCGLEDLASDRSNHSLGREAFGSHRASLNSGRADMSISRDVSERQASDVLWPVERDKLHRTKIRLISLHNLPQAILMLPPICVLDQLVVSAE